MAERRHETYLLTPGPLTVPREIKEAMLLDRSPNATLHATLTAGIRRYLVEIANGVDTHECVLVQGSATYGIEAGLHTLMPADGRLLVVQNGFYGLRLKEIATGMGRDVVTLDMPMLPLPTGADVAAALDADPAITHVVICHAETGTGVLNPIADIAAAVRARGREFMIDAVASFAGFPIDLAALDPLAVFVSPNKCLESVPGVGIVLARRSALVAAEGRSPSPCLDLHAQWAYFEKTGNWRPARGVLHARSRARLQPRDRRPSSAPARRSPLSRTVALVRAGRCPRSSPRRRGRRSRRPLSAS